ncbi:MAG: bifunctional oligoribonuclease/PAP phosphatase NrnA [Candidatus Gracilibacteria bacterium]
MNDNITTTFREAKKLIERSEKILLISHRRPDGDTLGANIAIHLWLQSMGKQTTLACIDVPSERYDFLPDIRRFVNNFTFTDYDLIIVCDAGAYYMTQFHTIYPDIFSGVVPVLNIDHHASNDNFGTLNIVDPHAASATLIIYRWFTFLRVAISPAMATALLAGIYNDTGSLMHSNTTQEVYEVSSDLVSKGARVNSISRSMFRSNTLSTLKLWGRVLENMKVTDDGVCMSVLTMKDFGESGAHPDESGGVIDLLNAVPDTKFCVLLAEDGKGNIKGSFRTRRDDVDLSALAANFNGGGHKKAAGFSMPGSIQKETIWKIVADKPLAPGMENPIHGLEISCL